MSWIQLPNELRVLILSIRYDKRQNAQKMIANTWQKFQAPKLVAHHLIEKEKSEMTIRHHAGVGSGIKLNIDVMESHTANIMEYCAKILSGKEKPDYWNKILNEVEYELWLNEYSGGPQAKYKSRSNDAFDKLIKKFNYIPKWMMINGYWE